MNSRERRLRHGERGVNSLRLQFYKLSGAGNDFVLIDRTHQTLPYDLIKLAVIICRRHSGVGADGLIIYDALGYNLCRISLLNPDGSAATTCGNAIRCAALYSILKGEATEPEVLFGDRAHSVIRGDRGFLSSTFESPRSFRGPIQLGNYEIFQIYTGTDHAVVFCQSVAELDIEREGARLRNHPAFGPSGTNVNFVHVISESTIAVRTYERGVEAETLSCGSGAVAAAIVSHQLRRVVDSDIQVLNCTDTPLHVRFSGGILPFSEIRLSGPADLVFEGSFIIYPS